MIWPIARVLASEPRALSLLEEMGFSSTDLAEHDKRVSCRKALHALDQAVLMFGDPLLGLRAGEFSDESFDVMEHAARSAENLEAALQVMVRYNHVMNEGADMWIEHDERSLRWCFLPHIPYSATANDFVIASALSFAKRNCTIYTPPPEVWVMHAQPSYADAYAKYFETQVRYGAPHNAVVMYPFAGRTPMLARNPALAVAFEKKAQALLSSVSKLGDVERRVREELVSQFAGGSVDMKDVARTLGMSVATLRRKLEDEGTSFTNILDELRNDAAIRHLRKAELSVSEIAFLLGFSDVRAFGRAFKRWTGASPSEFRAQQKAAR